MKIHIPTPYRRCTQILKCSAFAVATIFALGAAPSLKAASSSWDVDAAGTWVTETNWTGSVIPGIASGTGSTDIATFATTLTAARSVTVDNNRNVGGITFNNTSAFAYNLASGNIQLSNGGVILSDADNGAHTDTILGVIIQGDGGSAAFTNNATSGSNRLIIGGGVIQGRSTTGNTTVLTLNGSNVAANTVSGPISDGSNGGKLAIVKEGGGNWRLSGTNTFSGGVTLNAGQLGFTSNVSNFGTGTLTINGGILESNNALADATYANNIVIGGNFTIRDVSVNTLLKTFSGDVNLSGGTRVINTSIAGSDFIFSGEISNGGLEKAGVDSLTLSGVNTYTGNTTVSAGTLVLADNSQTSFAIGANGVNNAILGTGTISLNGDFSFDLSGAGVGLGDSWNIVNLASLTESFGSTFSVLGFSDLGSGLWEKSDVNGGRTYQFAQSSGLLAVTAIPEPSTFAFIIAGLVLFASRRRRI